MESKGKKRVRGVREGNEREGKEREKKGMEGMEWTE